MDKKILSKFIEDNYSYFKSYLHGRFRTLNEYEIEDIVQHTIMKFIFRGEKTSSIKHLSSYVYTSLSNSAIDYFKQSSRHISEVDVNSLSSISVEYEVLTNELREYLLLAIDTLDEKSKYIFIETELNGRSYEDLSLETGEKIGTLLSRKSRAKKKLQIILKEYSGR